MKQRRYDWGKGNTAWIIWMIRKMLLSDKIGSSLLILFLTCWYEYPAGRYLLSSLLSLCICYSPLVAWGYQVVQTPNPYVHSVRPVSRPQWSVAWSCPEAPLSKPATVLHPFYYFSKRGLTRVQPPLLLPSVFWHWKVLLSLTKLSWGCPVTFKSMNQFLTTT